MATSRASTRADTVPWHRAAEQFGPYAVHELLASGGLSLVHRATDTRSGREVALKRLHDGFETEWVLVDAFVQEARLGSQLAHPHVARTLAYGKLDGTYFAANELVRGPTLAEVVRQSRSAAGAIPPGVVVELIAQLCDALDHLHTSSPRVVLCGLAPAAVMVSSTGRAKLIDLGIAGMAARRRAGVSVADPRGDLFALGAIAYELLTGRAVTVVGPEPAPPPSRWARVPAALDAIVLRALAADPAERWSSAVELGAALGEVAQGLGGRLRMAQQLREWMVWAFTREPRRNSSQILRVVDAIEAGA